MNNSSSINSVLYQGEAGAYSQKACKELLGDNILTIGQSSFNQVFDSLYNGISPLALIPIENTSGGSIHDNYDLLFRYNISIVGEFNLRVRHCLVALKGVSKEDVSYEIEYYILYNLYTIPLCITFIYYYIHHHVI